MNTIIERITEAIKDILIGLIKSCLDNMFTSVNEQVGTIAGQVGQTPQGWNAGIFNLIQNISQTVIVPIAGLIITFVLCYELITMVTQKNNFHEFETYNIFLWIFKAYVAIYLVTKPLNEMRLMECTECEMSAPGAYDIDIEADDINVTDTATVIWEIA